MKAKRTHDEASKRRVRAGRLLLAGKTPAEVARMVGAPRQTVYRWREELKVGGIEALRDINKGGRPAQLGGAELSQLYVALLEGPSAHGFSTPLWTLKRVRLFIERELSCLPTTVDQHARVACSPRRMYALLSCLPPDVIATSIYNA